MVRRLKVFIINDQVLVRDAFAYYLEHNDHVDIIGRAGIDPEGLAAALSVQSDVVLIIISLPIDDTIEAVRRLKASNRNIKLVALSIHPEHVCLASFVDAGGLGYVRMNSSAADLLKAIKLAHLGEAFLSPEGIQVLVKARHTPEPDVCINYNDILSDREKQVLIGIIHGYNMREIGEKLFLSKSTVETYKVRIFEKLDLDSMPDLVAYAIRHKLYRE